MLLYFKKRPHLLILGFILLLGLFFRSYQMVERFEFAHDGDLYSWIVKDIVVNHHFRLIGQLTSAPGIFIGSLFYYLLIPFFLLSNMDPIGVTYFAILIGLSTILSYYFVLKKLFKTEVGLIAAFLYAALLTNINADRWVVPTITTHLWVIWYFYAIIRIVRGDFKVLFLLGILVGLIWQVHIALIPALIAIPTAVILSKKLPKRKQIAQFVIAFFLTSLPLIVFEIRHGFGQTTSLVNNFLNPGAGVTGSYKLILVTDMITKNINSLFFAPQSFPLANNVLSILIILLSAFWLIKKKVLLKKECVVFCIWIIGVIGFFGLSSSPVSEYYFINIEIIFTALVSLFLYLLYKSSAIGKILTIGLLILIPLKNGYFMITQDYYNKGYLERKELVEYIVNDVKQKNFPCIGISYIAAPGENVGFRYLFYLNNVHLIHPSVDVPVYNIVIPDELSPEVAQKFGHIGLIPPTRVPSKEIIQKSCQTPDTNSTDSMFGYTD